MGQSQMLLLVLVILIIGIAIVLAVTMFNENAASANLDRVTYFLTELGSRAQKYYRTPIWLAGGGHSFSGITADAQGIALLTSMAQTEDGQYTVLTAGNDTQVTLQGIGIEDGDHDGTNCTATIQVFADSMSLSIINR